MSSSLLFIVSVFFITNLPSSFSANQFYEQCLSPLRCGSNTTIFPNITYPFWGNDVNKPKYCGQSPFKLSCEDEETLAVKIDHHTLRVISTNLKNNTITVADESLFEDRCPKIWNFSGNNYFSLTHFTDKIDLFKCSNGHRTNSLSSITCRPSDNGSWITYHVFGPLTNPDYGCVRIGDIPILTSSKDELHQLKQGLKKALQQGFGLRYNLEDKSCQTCTNSSGICGSDSKSETFRCLCQDRPHNVSCTDEQVSVRGDPISKRKKIIIVVVSVSVGLLIASIVCLVYHRKRIKLYKSSSALLQRNISSEPSSKTFDVEKAEELLVGVRLFSYEELEEATDNFNPSKELGDGGFGTVYFGKLKDGRKVAVKRLYDNHFKRAEQFKNEVEILTGLRHPNLVTLFGCSSKQSRELLLVYEYVENGALADHLHGSHANSGSLPWSIRLKIAVETASALKYLHASKIIHRDVKSNNILLDQNFNVKVADFGLSRLFPVERTHVSTAPQGTPGYVDPDYHLCYQLSNKSDVYSFAVVLMELISSLPAVDISRPRQEINLSNMALLKIQNHELRDMVDPSLGFDTDTRVRETVIAVAELAFQCLQPDKDLRPCMTDVLDTLTRIQNDGFGSDLEVVGVDKSLIIQSPNTVFVKWDSK